MPYFVRFDTPSVKKYVFATKSLKEIRGASAILENLTHEDARKVINETKGEIFYLSGGSGLIMFNHETAAKDFASRLPQVFFQRTITAQVKIASKEFKESTPFAEVRAQLNTLLATTPPIAPIGVSLSPATPLCSACKANPVKKLHDFDADSSESLCEACLKKIDHMKKRKDKISHLPYLLGIAKHTNQKTATWNPPESLATVGEACETRKGYVGLIYADGNQMGRALERLEDHQPEDILQFQEIAEKYREFSQNLKNALEDAVYSSIMEAHPEGVIDEEGITQFASEILFLGGDDLLLVCPADHALAIGAKIAQKFEDTASIKKKGMSLSVGILIAQSQIPIYTMQAQAEQLLKSAKKHSFWLDKKDASSRAAIDFSVLTTSSAQDLSDSRESEWQLKDGTWLTGRPYSVQGILNLIDWAKRMRDEKISVGRLSQLQAACRISKAQGNLALFSLLGRMEPHKRDVMMQIFREAGAGSYEQPMWTMKPRWGQKTPYTVINDILEIFPFI